MRELEEFRNFICNKPVCIHCLNELIDKKKIIQIVKSCGIKNKLIFGYCNKGCSHRNIKSNLDIEFVVLGRTTLYEKFKIFITNIFREGDNKLSDEDFTLGIGKYLNNEKGFMVYVNLPNLIGSNFGIEETVNLLKHELMHLKYIGHCDKVKCAFSFGSSGKCGLCSRCNQDYKEILKKINSGVISK